MTNEPIINQKKSEPNLDGGTPPIQLDSELSNGIISAPMDYLLDFPGKGIRGQLIEVFNQWLKVPSEKLSLIQRVVELLHTASLLIDDIQDSSILRRGLPVAHSIFGIAQTINSANNAYFLAQHELHKLCDPMAMKIFTEELLRLHHGQGMDLYWRDSLTCPTEKDYLAMVTNKTGGLFRLGIKLMQIASESEKDYVPLVDLLAMMFQIRDDYQNLECGDYTQNKGFGEDLTEGKFSFPMIHGIRHSDKSLQLMGVLKQKTEDIAVKKYAIDLLQSSGSLAYCKKRLLEFGKEAREVMERLGSSGDADGMNELLDFLEMKEKKSHDSMCQTPI